MADLRMYFSLIATFLLFAVCSVGCGTDKKVKEMKRSLLNLSAQGNEGCWTTEYDYELTDDISLRCKEILVLFKNGTYKERDEYYYDGQLMAKVSYSGEWEISAGENDAYYFDQTLTGDLTVENVNFSDVWFEKFDTDTRINYRGSYGSDSDTDDESDCGFGIIDCTPKVFIIQDLSDDEFYRYTPYVPYLDDITNPLAS